MATWQVQQAKARLSELIDDAQTQGPQIITKHGSETAVLISIADYRSLSTGRFGATSLRDHLLDGPKFDDSQNPFEDLRSGTDTGREISL